MKTFNIVLSEGCNLDCSYCGVNKRSTDKINPVLCIDEFRKVRQQFPHETIKVDLFGGEPLMQMPLIREIVDGLADDGNIKWFLPTNGILLTREIVDYMIEHNVAISLSCDGLWQDRNRIQSTGKGTLQRLLDKQELLRSIPDLRIHTMIARGCYNLLDNYLYLRDMFGVNAHLTLVRDVGVWSPASVKLLLAGVTELVDWYISNPAEPMPNFIRFYFRHFLMYHIKKEYKNNCGAGTSIFMFSANKVLPCTRFNDRPDLIERIPQYANMAECNTCEVNNYCTKGCLFEQIKNEGPIVELCTIYRFMYHEISRMARVLTSNEHFTATVLEEIENGI